MKTQSPSRHPQEFIGSLWGDEQSPEQKSILGLAQDALDFVATTGQRYPFEDFRAGVPLPEPLGATEPREEPQDGTASLRARMEQTREFFERLRDGSGSAEERQVVQVILDTLRFISETRQHGAFRDFLEHVEAGAAPYVVASFATREEAEAWFRAQPSPARRTWLRIAGSLFLAAYFPNIHHRALFAASMAEGRDEDPSVAH